MAMKKPMPAAAGQMPEDPQDQSEDMKDPGDVGENAGEGQKGASEIVTRVNADLNQLASLMEGSSAVSPEDKQMLQQIMQQFQEFVMGLGQAQGAQKAPSKAMPGVVPEHAGANAVQPAL